MNFLNILRSSIFYITILLLTFATTTTHGQFGAKFSLVADKGCAPFTVSVIDSSGAPPGNVNVYNYGEIATVTQDTFYTYTTPGIYMINQLVPNGNPRDTSIFVEVVAPVAPIYNLSNCKGSEAFFYGDDPLYQAFWVDWGDGNSEIILNKQIRQHNYGVLGNFTVTVQGMMDPSSTEMGLANINCSTSTTFLSLILDIVPGTIDRIESLNRDSLMLNFAINNQTSYYLEMSVNGSSSFNIIDTRNGPTF